MRAEYFSVLCMITFACGCSDRSSADAVTEHAPVPTSAPATSAALVNQSAADDSAFPVIPLIIIPSFVGSGEAQRALENSMKSLIDPIAGITVRPANCATDGGLINETGFTNVDSQGNLQRISEEGVFEIASDGSGLSVGEHGVVDVKPDGSGSVINSAGSFEVRSDGSGQYIGEFGTIELDGKGGGTWVGEHGSIENHGDGSGTWVGEGDNVEIHADGSGVWIGGPDGIVENRGDGTGTVGAIGHEVKMAPLPPIPPAGRFPLLDKFSAPGAPCGFVITLSDRVLFDFDKSDIRPDAGDVLDTLATALGEISVTKMEIRGHTDAKGDDDYNQALSERRAEAVMAALRQRGAASDASARGFGESQPVASNAVDGKDNPGGRQLNRRVEIFIRT